MFLPLSTQIYRTWSATSSRCAPTRRPTTRRRRSSTRTPCASATCSSRSGAATTAARTLTTVTKMIKVLWSRHISFSFVLEFFLTLHCISHTEKTGPHFLARFRDIDVLIGGTQNSALPC